MYFAARRICYTLLILISAIFLSSGVWAREAVEEPLPAPPPKKIIRHVILVTFDGVTEKGLEESYTPNLNGLASSGIYAPGMDVLPADTAYHLAAILSGADLDINGFSPAARNLKTEILPGIFRKYGRDAVYVAAKNTPAANFLNVIRDTVQVHTAAGSDRVVMDAALEQFEKYRPYFLGVVLSGAKKTPGAGEKYNQAIAETDGQLGRLLLKLRALGTYEESLIIVTGSNHEKNAGGQTDMKLSPSLVPVVMTGPGLVSGAKLPPVRIVDVAPTAALLTAVGLPETGNGMVIWNGLKAGAGFVEENLLQKRVQDLSKGFINSAWGVHQLQEEKRIVQTEKERIRKEKLEIQDIINRKDGEIKSLTGRIRVMQAAGFILMVVCGIGYVVEYRFLRKRFLMF